MTIGQGFKLNARHQRKRSQKEARRQREVWDYERAVMRAGFFWKPQKTGERLERKDVQVGEKGGTIPEGSRKDPQCGAGERRK